MSDSILDERFSCYLYQPDRVSELHGFVEVDWEARGGTIIATARGFARRLLQRFRSANIQDIELYRYPSDMELEDQADLEPIRQTEASKRLRLRVAFRIKTKLSRERASKALSEAGFPERKPGE